MNKKILLYISLTILFILGINIVGYAFTEKSLFNYLLANQNQQKNNKEESLLKELTVKDGTTVEYEGYSIELNEYIYDSKSGSGYCHFIVKNNSIEAKDIYYDKESIFYTCFGENRRFTLMPKTLDDKITFEVDNDKLNVYVTFSNHSIKIEDIIYLYDFQLNIDPLVCQAKEFILKDTECSKEFISENNKKIIINPFLIRITDANGPVSNISIIMKNGEKIEVINNDEIQDSVVGQNSAENNGKISYQIIKFKELINVKNIDYIICGKEKLID